MFMKKTIRTIAHAGLILFVWSCSSEKNPYGSNGTYGLISNDRVFGIVQNMKVGDTYAINNLGSATSGYAASSAASSASSAVSGSILSPLSSAVSSAGNLFSSNTQSASVSNNSQVTYYIKTDDGQQLTIKQIPQVGEQLSYPGQRVMVQKNGDYVRVYPANEENPLDPNQDLSSSLRR